MIAVRRFLIKEQINLVRNYASASKLVESSHDDTTGITTVSMARAPVNSLNLELLDALKTSLKDAQKNKSKGIILTSSLPTIFSGGLDIMEMYKPDIKRAADFWRTLQDTWATLYSLEIPTAAAINGASPAGGCLLAISCEYRVFVDAKHTIGLNETQLGIAAPEWFQRVYIATIGYRQAELALLKGSQFLPKEALSIGMVDELAVDKEDAIKKCQNYINSFARIPRQARVVTKSMLRQPLLSWLEKNKESDTNIFLSLIQHPNVQNNLDMYMKSLKKK